MLNTEVLVWRLFECTGEISYYLLYKGMQNSKQLEQDAGMSI
ncbi:MAG: YqzL family protein [Christensenellales bacterium]